MRCRLCWSSAATLSLTRIPYRVAQRTLSTVASDVGHTEVVSHADVNDDAQSTKHEPGTVSTDQSANRKQETRGKKTVDIKKIGAKKGRLTKEERDQIAVLKSRGLSLLEISTYVNRTENVIKAVLYRHKKSQAGQSEGDVRQRWYKVEELREQKTSWEDIAKIMNDEPNALRTWFLRERVNTIATHSVPSQPYTAKEDIQLLSLRYEAGLRWQDVARHLGRTTTSVAARHAVLVSRGDDLKGYNLSLLPLSARDIGKAARMKRNGFDWAAIVKTFPFKDCREIKELVEKRIRKPDDPAATSVRHWIAAEDQKLLEWLRQGVPPSDLPLVLPNRSFYSITNRLKWLRQQAARGEVDAPEELFIRLADRAMMKLAKRARHEDETFISPAKNTTSKTVDK